VTPSEAKRHTAAGGVGAIAGGGSRSSRAQPRREEAYFLYADDRSGEHVARWALIARLRTARGHCGHDPTETERRLRAGAC